MITTLLHNLQIFAACKPGAGGSFFGLPTWYKYLGGNYNVYTRRCEVAFGFPGDLPLVGLAIVDMLLRIAGLVTVGYIVYGGIQYVVSQGESDRTAKAQGTIVNAFIGLLITIVAIGVVSFVGNRIK